MPITDITVKVLEMTPDTITLQIWGEVFVIHRSQMAELTQLDALIQAIRLKLFLSEVTMNDDAQIKQVIEDTVFQTNGEFKI